MGVSGLSTYLQEKQRTLATTKTISYVAQTAPSNHIVVDAWAFIYKILNDSKEPWVYGGEYATFARDVTIIIKAWERLGIQPHFVFDGAAPAIKFPEMVKRHQENRVFPANLFFRTSSGRRNEATFLHEHRIIPPLVYGTCVATLRELNVPCTWADGEADQKCVEVAASLGGWVLSYDSDFAILNAEGYAGYTPLNEMTWEVQQELVAVAPLLVSNGGEDGWTQTIKSKGKRRSVHRPTTGDGRLCVRGVMIPPPGTVMSLTLTVYQPPTLASHFHIPTPFLPLLASLVGNDFTPDSYRTRFFRRGASSAQKIERVAEVLRSVLSGPRKARAAKRTAIPSKPGETSAAAPINRPDVPTLIKTAIRTLSFPEPTATEVDQMTDVIIDSILQYGAESSRDGPFASRPTSSAHRFQPDVNSKYLDAYRRGDFSPEVLDLVSTGTWWTNLFLENPDVQTCTRTVGMDLLTWICAILNDGIPIGVSSDEDEDAEDGILSSAAGASRSSIADDDEDEDELISVIEEQTDSEGEETRGRERTERKLEPESEPETDDDETDDDPYYSSYTDGVPPSLLTSALRRLRHERHKRGDASQSQTPVTSAGTSQTGSGGVTSPHFRSPPSHVQSNGRKTHGTVPHPRSVNLYLRSGQRILPFRVTVQSLRDLLSGRSQSHTQPLLPWRGPIQLQPVDTRLDVFLQAMQSNTAQVRALASQVASGTAGGAARAKHVGFALLVVSLRWVVIKMSERAESSGQSLERWKKSEAKAFLAACIGSSGRDGTVEDPPPSTAGPSSPTSPSAADFPPLSATEENALAATPRAVQLTSQILVSIECTQHLAQVLFLSDVLHVCGIERKFSGRRFHERLNSGSAAQPSQTLVVDDERELFETLWRAMEEDSKAEWWSEDGHAQAKHETRDGGAKQKGGQGKAATTGKKAVVKVQPGRMWSTLAALKD